MRCLYPLLLGACLSCERAGARDQATKASLQLLPCRVRDIGKLAECGTLEVLENPAAPDGKKIGLRVVRIPAPWRRTG